MRKLIIACVIFLLLNPAYSPARAHENRSRTVMRENYLDIVHKNDGELWADASVSADCAITGAVSENAISAALSEMNFIRYLAGLEPVEISGQYSGIAQYGALLMAANQSLSHEPEKPAGMEEEVYRKGAEAAACCNLVMLNWSEPDILSEAVRQFARDDGGANRFVLGHRRWLLYPDMKYTGFGLAQDEEGRSYAALYVMDESGENADYDMIAWPSAGAFPAEYMSAETPWSLSLNPEKYDIEKSALKIVMTEKTTGAQFVFDTMEETASDEDQYFVLGGGRMGDGPAYIFRPDLAEYDALMYGYCQNQVWTVEITGVFLKGGALAEPIVYTVEMASLAPIDPAAVEVSVRELTLKAGESVSVSAQVIPDWADDLSIIWKSSDEEIAVIDENGIVTAKKAGKCSVTAESVNGRYDEIEVTVEG